MNILRTLVPVCGATSSLVPLRSALTDFIEEFERCQRTSNNMEEWLNEYDDDDLLILDTFDMIKVRITSDVQHVRTTVTGIRAVAEFLEQAAQGPILDAISSKSYVRSVFSLFFHALTRFQHPYPETAISFEDLEPAFTHLINTFSSLADNVNFMIGREESKKHGFKDCMMLRDGLDRHLYVMQLQTLRAESDAVATAAFAVMENLKELA